MEITLPIEGTEYRRLKVREDNREFGTNTGKSFAEVLKHGAETGAADLPKDNNRPIEYTVQVGDHLTKIGRSFNKAPQEIANENGLSNPDLIYPGQKLRIYPSKAQAVQPRLKEVAVACWYGQEHQQKATASGQPFDRHKSTLAHKTLPFGTRVRLTNPENGKTAEGVVNDRGPVRKERDVDVSYALAKKLGFIRKGVTRLEIEII